MWYYCAEDQTKNAAAVILQCSNILIGAVLNVILLLQLNKYIFFSILQFIYLQPDADSLVTKYQVAKQE
jgi:hypothetical protein